MDKLKKAKSKSPLTIARKKFLKNKPAMIATVVLGLIAIISFLAPLLAPYDPNLQNLVLIKGRCQQNTGSVQILEGEIF